MQDLDTHTTKIASRIGGEEDSPEKKNRVRKAFFYAWTGVGFAVVFGIVVYLLGVLALPVSMLLWTLVIVFCLRGIVNGLEKRGVNRALGTTIAYLVMALVLFFIFLVIFTPVFGLSDQFANLISAIPGYVESIMGWMRGFAEKYSHLLNNDAFKSFLASSSSSLSEWASSMAGNAANVAVGVGAGIANTFYAVGFALVIAFWVLMELPAIGREVTRIMNPKHKDDAEFLHLTFTRILGGYIKGTIVQCFIIGAACGVLFAIIGVPNAPALGVITGVLNIIPIIGPWLGGAVAAISAVFVSPITAVIALLGTIVIQQFVYTFVSPKIMSNSVDIHPALTLVAMIFGSAIGAAMGGLTGSLVGMLFAIPAVAVIKSIFIYYFERSTGRQIVSKDGFVFKGNPTGTGIADPMYDATSGNSVDDGDSDGEKKGFFSRFSRK